MTCWLPDYGKDDRDKKIRRNWKIAQWVGIGVAVAALGAAAIFSGVFALGLIPATFVAPASTVTTAVGGAALTSATSTTMVLPTVAATMIHVAYIGGGVCGAISVMMPDGVPHLIWSGVRREVMSTKLAHSTLLFAESYASIALANKYCPPGSANDEHSTKAVDDPHAACRRQEIKSEDQGKSYDFDQKKQKMMGCAARTQRIRKSGSRANKDEQAYKTSVFMMVQFAKALTAVSDFQCEAIADESAKAHYRLR